MLRAIQFRRAESAAHEPSGRAVLDHEGRHIRRKVISLEGGATVLVDFPAAVALEAGDLLICEDGSAIEIIAAKEPLHEVVGRDARHLTELAWHIGNRHLAAQIEAGRILILRDHVIKSMLEGLGAEVRDVTESFSPLRGAYHQPGLNAHDHHHPGSHGRATQKR